MIWSYIQLILGIFGVGLMIFAMIGECLLRYLNRNDKKESLTEMEAKIDAELEILKMQ